MQMRQTPSYDVHIERGFVLPLTLVLIVALAFLLTLTMEQIASARARAAVFNQIAINGFDRHAVEQDIVYRALLERFGRDYSRSLDLQSFTYKGAAPTGEWAADSQAFVWGGVYQSGEQTNGIAGHLQRFDVKIQDTSGLLDINYTDEAYVTFLADYLSLPTARQRRAVSDLRATIDDRKWLGDSRSPRVHGFYRPAELCLQEIWREAPICDTPSKVAFTLTAREGRLPNFDTMPTWMRRYFVPDYDSLPPLRARSEWDKFRRERGMLGVFEAFGGLRLNYIVAIHEQNTTYQDRFMLDVVSDRQGRPYTIIDRITEPVDDEAFGLNDGATK